MSRIEELGEFGLIARITKALPTAPSLIEGIGDDCAVVRSGGETLLLTCDAAIEDVHFSRAYLSPEDIGWRSAAAAISDIAAMGGAPRFLLVTLAIPGDMDAGYIEALYQGLGAAVAESGAIIAGGDITRSPGGLMLDISVIGVPVTRCVTRAGARPGDVLAITGWPGQSAAGRRALVSGWEAPVLAEAHRRPCLRVAEGQWLAEHEAVRAMIDVSDGLAQDAGHIAERSGVAVDILRASLPVSNPLRALAEERGVDAEACILGGGEDYELLAALEPGGADALCADFEANHGLPLCIVGRFSEGIGVRLDGAPVEAAGFDHFRRD